MKFILGLLTIAFFSSSGFSNTTDSNAYLLNTGLGNVGRITQVGTLINKTRNLLVGKYSFAVQGGSTAADISLRTILAESGSLAVLPNKAIITNVWVDVVTAPTSGGSATIALKAVNSGDLLAATAIGTLATFKQGIPNGATTTFIKLTAAKTIKATIATATLTAGKLNVYIEYVEGD